RGRAAPHARGPHVSQPRERPGGADRVAPVSEAQPRVGIGLGEVVGLVTGAGAAYGIVAAASPILTRLYSPADFGPFQIYITVFSFLLIAAAWRFEVAVLLPKEERGGVQVAVLGIAAVAITTAVTAIAWAVLTAAGALHGRLEVVARYGWILPVAAAGGGGTAGVMEWAPRGGDYRAGSVGRGADRATQCGPPGAPAGTPARR